MDDTYGIFTTHKLQTLIDFKFNSEIKSRRDLAASLTQKEERISIHGIEAWFKRVDSNYNLQRPSLSNQLLTYSIPKKRWESLLKIFDLAQVDLDCTDKVFRENASRRVAGKPDFSTVELSTRYSQSGLVGREEEFKKLLQLVQNLRVDDPRIVLLEGGAGNGKSRLLAEFVSELEKIGHAYLIASCVEDCEVPLLPILDLIVMQVENSRRFDKRLLERLREIIQGFNTGGDSGSSTPELFVELTSLLLELSRIEPMVVVLDDLHWVDESTARFLEHLLRHTSASREFRILFIGAYRPLEVTGRWHVTLNKLKDIQHVSMMKLVEFNQKDTYDFLDKQSEAPMSLSLKEFLWNMSLGNILFLQQTYEHLTKTDQLYSRSGYIEAVSYEKIEVPKDLPGVYLDRYMACTKPTKNLLDFSAALGIHFDLQKLQYTFRKFSLDAVIDCLEEAESMGLISYRNDRFSFVHPIARHCIYGAIPEMRKAGIHHSIAQRFLAEEHLVSDQSNVEIALHMVKGKMYADPILLVRSCYRAAFRSLSLGAWDQVRLFSEVALNEDGRKILTSEEFSELSKIVGTSFHQSGNPETAIEHLTQAYDGFKNMGDEVESARVLNDICRIRGNFGLTGLKDLSDLDELKQYIPKLSSSNPVLAAWILDTVATRMMYASEINNAAENISQALSLLESHEESVRYPLIYVTAALIDLQILEVKNALKKFQRAHHSALRLGDKGTMTRVLQRIVTPSFLLARFDDVFFMVEEMRRNRNVAVSTGEFSLPLAVLVGALSLKGDLSEARKLYLEGLELIKTSGYAWGLSNLLGAFASVCVKQGNYDEALEVVGQATGNPSFGPISKSLAGIQKQLEWYISDLQAGTQTPEKLPGELQMTEGKRALDTGKLSRYAIGLELALKRDDELQIEMASHALESAHNQGVVFTLGWPFCVQELLAKVCARRGDLDLARYYLTIAVDHCEQLSLNEKLSSIGAYWQSILPASDVLMRKCQSLDV